MKFTSGFLLGTAAGVVLFAQAIVYIWKNDRLMEWAKETDAALNEKFGHRGAMSSRPNES